MSACMRRAVSIPSSSAIRTSTSTRSGCNAPASSIARAPDAASPTCWKPFAAAINRRTVRGKIAWSSTVKTVTSRGPGKTGTVWSTLLPRVWIGKGTGHTPWRVRARASRRVGRSTPPGCACPPPLQRGFVVRPYVVPPAAWPLRPFASLCCGEMGSLAKTLTLRTVQGLCVVGITAALALWIPRWSHPELYPDEQGWGGLLHAMRRAFLHFDFGVACGWVGCPKVSDMWMRAYVADVWMLLGTVAIGVGAGFAIGVWCAARAGSRRARVVERSAVILYCAPVYVVGLGVLLLFHPTFGTLGLPYFFDATTIRASPLSSPWDWFRSLLVPWLVAAAPLAAMCLRLVVALLREQQGTDHVRTAIAKGVPHKRVIRHHAGPFAHAATASLVGVSAPVVVINLILVERVFSVPGFFLHTFKATGHTDNPYQDGLPHAPPPAIDLEMLVGIAIWASVFVIVLSFAMEFALVRLDPRVRTAQQL